jgi:hypothetical protein
MDETPSNYNIPNGRFDGKSMGLMFGVKNGSPAKVENSPRKVVNVLEKKQRKKFRAESRLDSTKNDESLE